MGKEQTGKGKRGENHQRGKKEISGKEKGVTAFRGREQKRTKRRTPKYCSASSGGAGGGGQSWDVKNKKSEEFWLNHYTPSCKNCTRHRIHIHGVRWAARGAAGPRGDGTLGNASPRGGHERGGGLIASLSAGIYIYMCVCVLPVKNIYIYLWAEGGRSLPGREGPCKQTGPVRGV